MNVLGECSFPIGAASKCLQNDFKMSSKWLQSDFKMSSKWHQNDFKVTSKWLQNDFKMTSKWLQNDFKMRSRFYKDFWYSFNHRDCSIHIERECSCALLMFTGYIQTSFLKV